MKHLPRPLLLLLAFVLLAPAADAGEEMAPAETPPGAALWSGLDDVKPGGLRPPVVRDVTPPGTPRTTAPAPAPSPAGTSTAATFPRPAAAAGTASSRSTIADVTKNHNLTWRGSQLALRLDLDLHVHEQEGRVVQVRVAFHDLRTGASVMPSGAVGRQGGGALELWTRAVRVQEPAVRFAASLWVPYRAFPRPAGVSRYDVEARIVMVSRAADGGEETEIARNSTTFTVHATVTEEEPAPTEDLELGS